MDTNADVIVVGFGCAGAVAALTAREKGADVLIVEKQPSEGRHTNTSMSGGSFLYPTDARAGMEHLMSLSTTDSGLLWTDEDVIRAWAEYAVETKTWLESHGGRVMPGPSGGEHSQVPGYDGLVRCRFRGMGPGMERFFSELVQEKGIRVMYDTAARRLITDSKRRVVGVEVESHQEGKVARAKIRAGKGVVLASGGFEFNEAMKLTYLKVYPTHFTGSEANTGDGISMAVGVGADLWHMNCVSARLIGKFPGVPMGIGLQLFPHVAPVGTEPDVQAKACGGLVVDRTGRRFTNEEFKAHTLYYELALYDTQRLLYPRVPSYWVFDRNRMEGGPLPSLRVGAPGPSRILPWSRDNASELEKGWIRTAPTIRELARSLDMDPDTLEMTLDRYNAFCEKGIDADFGRSPGSLVPLERPPYYCVEMWPGGPNTQGGPRRNAKAEVLNTDGDPIPGLYSAGELGAIYGMLYPGAGGNLTECVAFGRIAGENVATGVL